ncbi:MAG: SRPBCC domain-containing protein, partial [Afipia sp.]|nr:SRPBCC domain-containing protein [Afipia sp.]
MSRPEFVYVTYIKTTPEKLWEALTSSEITKLYWFGAHLESDWKVGAPWKIVFPDGRVADSGEIL